MTEHNDKSHFKNSNTLYTQQQIITPKKLHQYYRRASSAGKCIKCMLIHQYCICQKLFDLRIQGEQYKLKEQTDYESPEITNWKNEVRTQTYDLKEINNQSDVQIEIFLLMHLRERFKASNTGKVIYSICNDEAIFDDHSLLSKQQRQRIWGLGVTKVVTTVIIADVPEDETHLIQKLEKRRSDPICLQVVLFPSSNALYIDEVIKWHKEQLRLNDQFSSSQCDTEDYQSRCELITHYQFVVLDGTWRQARRMNSKVPHWIKRICLSKLVVSEFLIRKQSQLGRISTVEALSLAMKELSDAIRSSSAKKTDVSSKVEMDICTFFECVAKLLLSGLGVLVEAVIQQSHKEIFRNILKTRNANCALPSQSSNVT